MTTDPDATHAPCVPIAAARQRLLYLAERVDAGMSPEDCVLLLEKTAGELAREQRRALLEQGRRAAGGAPVTEIPDDASAAGPVPGVTTSSVVVVLQRLARSIRENALPPEAAAQLLETVAEKTRRGTLADLRDPRWLTEPWPPAETPNDPEKEN